jgi:hypothetical protein
MIRTFILRWFNHILSALAGLGAVGVLVFSGEWALSAFEQGMYFLFFLSFVLAFLLFGRAYPWVRTIKSAARRPGFIVANGILILLFALFLGFAYHQLNSEHRLMLDAKSAYARIYRVDPEGYRKKRKIYYTFEVEGERYTGVEYQPDPSQRIGDSIRIVFSQGQPTNNRVLK